MRLLTKEFDIMTMMMMMMT